MAPQVPFDHLTRHHSIGLAGIAIEGSFSATQDTADNLIFGNSIEDIDPDGDHAASETSGIRFGANGGTTYLPRRNHVVENLIDCGANGKRGVLAGSGAGTVNFVLRNRIRNAQSSEYQMDATVVPYYQTEQAGNVALSGTLDLGGVTTQTLGVSGGRFQVEGVNVPTISSTDTLTNKTLTTPTLTTPRGVAYLLARSAVAASHTGSTSETTLATVTVPAGAMGANGHLRIRTLWSAGANNANAKTPRIRFDAGTTIAQLALANQLSVQDDREIANRNSAASQVFFQGGTSYSYSTLAIGTTTVNTVAARDLTFTIQLADGADTATLEYYEVWLTYGA